MSKYFVYNFLSIWGSISVSSSTEADGEKKPNQLGSRSACAVTKKIQSDNYRFV